MRVQPARPNVRRAKSLWEVGTSYNKRRLLWEAVHLVQAVSCVRRTPRPPYWRGAAWVQAQPAARKRVQAQPAALAASAACEGFLWAVIRFVFAVTGMRRIPPGGPARFYAPPYGGGGFLWEVGTPYNERRLLWKAVHLVWAVTAMRIAPRRRRELHAGSACRTCRIRGVRGFYGKSVRPIMSGGFYEKRCALCKRYLA